MIKMDISSINEVLLQSIRNISYGDLSDKTRFFTEKLFLIIKSNINWLITKQSEYSLCVFFKALRLYTGFSYLNEQLFSSVKRVLLDVIVEIWKNKKIECFKIGRELMRVLQETFRHNVKLSHYCKKSIFIGIQILYTGFIRKKPFDQ